MNRGISLVIFTLLGLSYGVKIDYKVSNCLLATIDASVDVQIGGKSVQLNNTAVSSGYCTVNASSLQIGLDKNANLTLNFEAIDGNSVLTDMTVTFKNGNSTVTSADNVEKTLSPTNAWYACDYPETFQLSGGQPVKVTIESIKIQPFELKDGKYSDNKTSCHALSPPTTEQPTSPGPTSTSTAGTTATPETSTSKPAPTGTPAPKAEPIEVFVNTTSGVCLLLKFTGTLSVSYVNKTGYNDTYIYPIDGKKSVSGTCGNDEQTVKLTLKNDWILTFEFTKKGTSQASRRLLADGTSYYMGLVKLTYYEQDIPGNKNRGIVTTVSNSTDRYETDIGTGFTCKSEEVISMSTASLSTIDFEAEAFRNSNSTNFAENPKVCAADYSSTSNIVPIVVGVVLALLVLVIIIAYLIGRRRNQSGYQSV